MKLIKYLAFFILFANSFFASSQTITVGVFRFAAPFSAIEAGNHFVGFSIDLMSELCKRINDTCRYKAIDPQQVLEELAQGTVTISFTSSPIPQKPIPNYIYSLPYMTSSGQIVTNDPKIRSLQDLHNKKIGVFRESDLNSILLLYTSNKNIIEYSEPAELIEALKQHQIDAILFNLNIYKYLTINQIINFQTVGNHINIGNGYGILALKKNASLINKINKALLEMENDGTYEQIYTEYFGQ